MTTFCVCCQWCVTGANCAPGCTCINSSTAVAAATCSGTTSFWGCTVITITYCAAVSTLIQLTYEVINKCCDSTQSAGDTPPKQLEGAESGNPK